MPVMPESAIAKRLEASQVTPLVIILSFILLTEVVVMSGVLGTTDLVQVILCVFCVIFPPAVAVPFFLILYMKPWVFYGPRDYGIEVDPEKYISAISNRTSLADEISRFLENIPGIVERAMQSQTVREAIDSSDIKISELSRVVGQSVAEEIERNEVLAIDLGEFNGPIFRIPVHDEMSVSDLLDNIYFEMSRYGKVKPFSYGKSWLLVDEKTDKQFTGMGTKWAIEHGMDRDERLLEEVGITSGSKLKVVKTSGSKLKVVKKQLVS
jgi:hypothetical protein